MFSSGLASWVGSAVECLRSAAGLGVLGSKPLATGTMFGVDQSESILDIFRRKLVLEPDDVRQRVRLHLGDMRTFQLDQQFALALIPFRPLQHIEDQLTALTNARPHLVKSGILGFDVFLSEFRYLDQPDGVEKLESG